MNESFPNHPMNKIVCPACEKEITEQAPIEIPTSDMETTPSVRVDSSASIRGSSPANIYFKNGKYYLVLETMCSCPYCHTYFELDIPIEFAELRGKKP